MPFRCGTVYVSFGPSPHNSAYIMVGKYTNAKLVSQYYQPAVANASFNTAGQYTGGYQCGNTSTSTGGSGSGESRAASSGWAKLSNGGYQAQPGATLSSLGALLGISYFQLAAYNCIGVNSIIQVGQVIFPTQQSCHGAGSGGSPSGGSSGYHCTYTVKSGDTLSGIAAQYGISYQQLAAANGISAPYIIDADQILHVPCSGAKGSGSGGSGGSAPSGYRSGGFLCGQELYVPNIPGSWPLSSAMPAVYNPDNIVWINVCYYTGGPKRYILNAKTMKAITNYSLLASYYGSNGKWSGNAVVVKNHFFGPAPFIGDRSASINWGLDVCGSVN